MYVLSSLLKMVQLGSFLGVWPVRKGSFFISLFTLIFYIALFVIYIIIYEKKELDNIDKYTAFDVWVILAIIVAAIKIIMGGALLFAVKQEIPGLLMMWSLGFLAASLAGAVFDIALIVLWSWWMIIPVIVAVFYIYLTLVTFSYYKELSGTSFNTT